MRVLAVMCVKCRWIKRNGTRAAQPGVPKAGGNCVRQVSSTVRAADLTVEIKETPPPGGGYNMTEVSECLRKSERVSEGLWISHDHNMSLFIVRLCFYSF